MRARPEIPIIDYVSPSVWAWRPGRARKMKPYVDHLLALLPFEPAAHERLGGPPCTYVGHQLIERLDWIAGIDASALHRRLGLATDQPAIVVLPGSRSSEVERLGEVFGAGLDDLAAAGHQFAVLVPAVAHLRGQIEQLTRSWAHPVHILDGESDKFAAFKLARAALAASGTVTLELGLVGTPMVVAYRVDAVAARLRFLVKVPSIVLSNLVLGYNAFPEFIQEACTPHNLATALGAIIIDGPARTAQLEALAEVAAKMQVADASPSDRAADIVLRYAKT